MLKKFYIFLFFFNIINFIKAIDIDNSTNIGKIYVSFDELYNILQEPQGLGISNDNLFISFDLDGGMPRVKKIINSNDKEVVPLSDALIENSVSIRELKVISQRYDMQEWAMTVEALETVARLKQYFLKKNSSVYGIFVGLSTEQINKKIQEIIESSFGEKKILAFLYCFTKFNTVVEGPSLFDDGSQINILFSHWGHLKGKYGFFGKSKSYKQRGHIFFSCDDEYDFSKKIILQVVEYLPTKKQFDMIDPFLFISFLGKNMSSGGKSLASLIKSNEMFAILQNLSVNGKVKIKFWIKSQKKCEEDGSQYLGFIYEKYIKKVFGQALKKFYIDHDLINQSSFDVLNVLIDIDLFDQIRN